MFDPSVFIPHYLQRFLDRQEREGKPLPPGHYKIVLKVKIPGRKYVLNCKLAGWNWWGKTWLVSLGRWTSTSRKKPNPIHQHLWSDASVCWICSWFPTYNWREHKPCSDRVTRVLAVIMADEKDPIMIKMVLYLQKKQNQLLEGFTVKHKGEEYCFLPTFVDRYKAEGMILNRKTTHG